MRGLKASHDGVIDVSGTVLAQSLTDRGLTSTNTVSTFTPSCWVAASRSLPAAAAPPHGQRRDRPMGDPAHPHAGLICPQNLSPMASPAQLR